MRLVGSVLAASAGLAAAEIKSSLDAGTFQKLVLTNKAWTSKAVLHIKKKYGYDQHDMTEKMAEGLRKDDSAFAFDIELDLEPYQPPNYDSGDTESDWQIREKKQKKADQELGAKLGITDSSELPMIVIVDGAFAPENRVGAMKKMKVTEKSYSSGEEDESEKPPETTFEDVSKFLESNGLTLVEATPAPLDVSSEEETLLEEFVRAADEKSMKDIIAKVEALEKTAKQSKILIKIMKAASKFKTGVKAYFTKESKRITKMLASNAITSVKKAELTIKKNLLGHAMEAAQATEKEEL